MIIALYCKGPCIVPVCGHIDQTKHIIPISEPNRKQYQLPHHCGQLQVLAENAGAIIEYSFIQNTMIDSAYFSLEDDA